MPSTPLTPENLTVKHSARQTTDECRLNAVKSRKENDWFSHEFNASLPSPKTSLSSNVSGKTPKSGEWFPDKQDDLLNSNAFSVTGTSSTVHNTTPETRRIQQKVCVGSQQDWYKHGDNVPDPPSLSSKPKSRRSMCSEAKQKLTGADPNEWFRHDHGDSPSSSTTKSGKKISKETSNTGLWYSPEDTGNGFHADGMPTPRSKSRLTSAEADEYYKRDKIGSSADWYTHEHNPEEIYNVSPRGMKGTSDIANRLKGESEDWFSHDTNKGNNGVSHVKATSPLIKAQGDEIKQIFKMEENLQATWSAPSDYDIIPATEQNNGH